MKPHQPTLPGNPKLTAAVLFALVCLSAPTALAQTTAPSPYSSYIAQAKQQMETAKIQIEQLKLMQAEYRASRNEAAAKAKDAEIKRYQDQVTLKQQEMSMYQQMESVVKQPLSADPNVAAAQSQMRQWTIEKLQIGYRQTQANQAGNKAQADGYAQQMNTLQLRITAKQQEIRLLEMKAKAGQ